MRILIAEDEKDLNQILTARLAAEHYGVDSCRDGQEALDYLEQVRARARGTNTNVLPKVTTTNQLELCKAIHHERHVELALEFDRFYDLVRWQEFSIAGAEDGASAVLGNKGYTAKNKYLPLPQEQVDASNGVLVQNPDYAN